jgi:hypothetical protein
MLIEWLITDAAGREIAASEFNEGSPKGRNQFAARAREAWRDGHAVITRRKCEARRDR